MFSKLVRKEISRTEILKKWTYFEEQIGTRYIRGTFILALFSSASFCLQNLRFVLTCFSREIKGFYQSS